jgi:hypothetical protein
MDGHYCLPRRVPLEPPLSRSDTSPGYDFVNSELDESIGRTAPMRHIVDKSVSRAAKCEKSKGTKSLAPQRATDLCQWMSSGVPYNCSY